MRRLLAVATLAALIAAPAHAAQLGINTGPLFADQSWGQLSAAQVDGTLANLSAGGISRVRQDAPWLWTQSGPEAPYDWTFTDMVAGELAQHGLAWDATISGADWAAGWPGSADWLRQNALPDQAHIGAYMAFIRAFLTRYPQVRQIEVGNEPDLNYQRFGTPSPALYARIFQAAVSAARAVRPVAVIPAAMCCSLKYARTFARLDAHQFGSFAAHTYWISAARWLRMLDRLGLRHVRLVVNEFGWSTDPTPWGVSLQVPDEWTRDFNYRWTVCHLGAIRRVRLVEPYVWGADILGAYQSLDPVLKQAC